MSVLALSRVEPRDASKHAIAVAGSVLLNLTALYLVGLFLTLGGSGSAPPAEQRVNEVVVSLEELMPEIEAPPEEEPAGKSYLETYANQESEKAPENARFESDRNTLALTDQPAADPQAEAVPTQDGEEKIPFLELQEHRYRDGPDGEIPESAASAPGVPVPPSSAVQMPQEEAVEPETPDRPQEPEESENREEEPDKPDPEADEAVEDPAEGEKPDVENRELEEGEEGGASETLEMANVDLAKMASSFSDDLQIIDESVPRKEDEIDALPEKNPEIEDPTNPLLQAPAPSASAPMRAQQVPQPPQEAAVPLQPGSMASQPSHGQADSAAFSPERHRNKMKGALSNIGRNASMDAEATPLGKYKKLVSRAIERRWHELRLQNESFISYGSLKIRFDVTQDGRVRSLRVVHEDANAVMTDFSLQAVSSADIPPMPEEIINLLGREPLEVTYDIIIY